MPLYVVGTHSTQHTQHAESRPQRNADKRQCQASRQWIPRPVLGVFCRGYWWVPGE
jgi:hypothetical protein